MNKLTEEKVAAIWSAGGIDDFARAIEAEVASRYEARIAELESQLSYEREKSATVISSNVGMSLQLAAEQAHRVECVRLLRIIDTFKADDAEADDYDFAALDIAVAAAIKATPTEALDAAIAKALDCRAVEGAAPFVWWLGCDDIFQCAQVNGRLRHDYPDAWLSAVETGGGLPLYTQAGVNAAIKKALAGQWKDIAGAPKDGSHILIRFREGMPVCSSWMSTECRWWRWPFKTYPPTHYAEIPPLSESKGGE